VFYLAKTGNDQPSPRANLHESRLHIVLVNQAPIPAVAYGGTERVIWDLGKALMKLGHRVSYLVPEGSHCPFAKVYALRAGERWDTLIPADADLAHFQFNPEHPETIAKPWLMTQHGNSRVGESLPVNTVFVSADHARRHGSVLYVHNGLDWEAYGAPRLDDRSANYLHFLAKAAWSVKNVRGAIRTARRAGRRLEVLGGYRFNLRRGLRFTLSLGVRFHGMVGGEAKLAMLRDSSGLLFPVRWHEPFGLAVIESLYFGAPIFATPYGALPELVEVENGVLLTSSRALADAIGQFVPVRRRNHARACDLFNAQNMARKYLNVYAQVLNAGQLHATPPAMHEAASPLPWTD
jgi:glycosyltransferase involved in cell wall biosynthesis